MGVSRNGYYEALQGEDSRSIRYGPLPPAILAPFSYPTRQQALSENMYTAVYTKYFYAQETA